MTPYKVERHRHTPEIEQELAVLGASLPITFTPHLVPLAQGELVSCYVTPGIELGEGELADLYREAYEGEPWVEVALGPPGVIEVRDTNYCRISVHRDDRRAGAGVLGDRQPVEGRRLAGGAEPEPDVRARRERGIAMSRWVSLPDHAADVEGGLPQGFRASGVACGLKPSGGVDMGLLVSDSVGTVSAARFTRSGVLAAPVILCQERCRLDSLRAVVANAGNANAATGRRGVDNAARMQGAAAMAVGLDPEVVAVASTGVIGVQLPDRPITQGILAARGELSETGDEAFGEAIRTTDLFPKRACVDVRCRAGPSASARRPRARG